MKQPASHRATFLLRPGLSAPCALPGNLVVSVELVRPTEPLTIDLPPLDTSFLDSLFVVNLGTLNPEPNITSKWIVKYYMCEGAPVYEKICDKADFLGSYNPSHAYTPGQIVIANHQYYKCLSKVKGQAPPCASEWMPRRYAKNAYVYAIQTGMIYRAKQSTLMSPVDNIQWTPQPWQRIDDVGTKLPHWWDGDRVCASFDVDHNSPAQYSQHTGGRVWHINPKFVGSEVRNKVYFAPHMQKMFTKDVCTVMFCTEVHAVPSHITNGPPAVAFNVKHYVLPDGVYELGNHTPIPLEDNHRNHICTLIVVNGDQCPVILQPFNLPAKDEYHMHSTFMNMEKLYMDEFLECNRLAYQAVTTNTTTEHFINISAQTYENPDDVRKAFVTWHNGQINHRAALYAKAALMRENAEKLAEMRYTTMFHETERAEKLLRTVLCKYFTPETWLSFACEDIYNAISWQIKGADITAAAIQHAITGLNMSWRFIADSTGPLTVLVHRMRISTDNLMQLITQTQTQQPTVRKLKQAPSSKKR